MLGNSHNQISKGLSGGKPEELFSFLNKEKFLKAGCAKNFEATLNWHQGEPDKKTLDAKTAAHIPEKVKYLPQKYLERICANIADDEFRATLNEVIFRYIKPQDQYGKTNLDDLIKYPHFLAKIIGPYKSPKGLDWYYDSTDVLEKLEIPMLWLLGEKDSSAPNELTIPKLRKFIDAGKPFELVVFRGAEHSMLLFENKEKSGRVYTGYAPEYFTTQITRARRFSGLED